MSEARARSWGAHAAYGRPLIRAGDVFVLPFRLGGSGRSTPQGYIPDPPGRPKMAIEAVLFDDGTYDGDAQTAATMEAPRTAAKLQSARILAIIESVLKKMESEAVSLEKFQQELAALSQEPETAFMDELTSKYPLLAPDSKTPILEEARRGFRDTKENMLSQIEQFKKSSQQLGSSGDLRAWLKQLKESYQKSRSMW